MKRKITRTLLLIIMAIPIMTQYACSDEKKAGGSYNGPLKLNTFYPDSGYLSSKIIIEAENIGTDASQLSVYFNKKKGFISQASGNILMVYAPKLPGDICDISIVKGKDSLVFDKKFHYISRFTVENVCGKPDNTLVLNTDLATTNFQNWQIKAGCCDPNGNFYVCYSTTTASPTGGLALISEKNNLSKRILSVPANDVLYLEHTKKLYVVAVFRNIIYEIDPSNDWKAKIRYLKQPTPPAKQVDYDKTATIAYCKTDGYFYARTGTLQLYRFKLDDMVCEYLKDDKFNSAPAEAIFGNRYIVSMMFDPTEPTKLYTSYGSSAVITVQDVANLESEEEIYAGIYNQKVTDGNQVINGFRTNSLFNWNNQMSIVSDGDQKIMYIADAGSQLIRKIDMKTGMVTSAVGRQKVAGNQSGTPEEATFNWPKGVGLTPDGDLYISDSGSGCIRKLSLR